MGKHFGILINVSMFDIGINEIITKKQPLLY